MPTSAEMEAAFRQFRPHGTGRITPQDVVRVRSCLGLLSSRNCAQGVLTHRLLEYCGCQQLISMSMPHLQAMMQPLSLADTDVQF